LYSTGVHALTDEGPIRAAGIAFQIVNERIDHRLAGTRKNSKGILSVIDYVGVGYGKAAGMEYRNTVLSEMVPARFQV
jgi:hypothetical protein